MAPSPGFKRKKTRSPMKKPRWPRGSWRCPLSFEILEDRVLPSNSPLPITLAAVRPFGSLIYSGNHTSQFTVQGQTDAYTVGLAQNETLSILFQPVGNTSTIQGHIQLTGPSGQPLGSADAAAAGKAILLQAAAVLAAGSYEIDATSAVGSGSYSLTAYVNAAVQDPSLSNHSAAAAADIGASNVPLQGHADRVATVGQIDAAADADYYQFTLPGGQASTLA